MYRYPKQILTIAQQIQSYIDAGMIITSRSDVEKTLKSVGFYRLRGYSFHLYDNATKKYVSGTKFEDVLKLYHFDQEISALIFSMISKIEVALSTISGSVAYTRRATCFTGFIDFQREETILAEYVYSSVRNCTL